MALLLENSAPSIFIGFPRIHICDQCSEALIIYCKTPQILQPNKLQETNIGECWTAKALLMCTIQVSVNASGLVLECTLWNLGCYGQMFAGHIHTTLSYLQECSTLPNFISSMWYCSVYSSISLSISVINAII